jgi:hypothetical protein
MRYKITISEGCTAFYTTINEKIIDDDFTLEEADEIIDYLCEQFKKKYRQKAVQLNDLVRCFQSAEWDCEEDSCEQCGDTVVRETWEL